MRNTYYCKTIWNDYSVAFFDESVGLPLSREDYIKNRCGAGYKSLAFDNEGNIYPCIRFLDMCSESKKKYVIGHIDEGINMNLVCSLSCTSWRAISPQKCLECEVGTGCGWCVAHNFEDKGSIFRRATYLCDMHKANARANQYFWNRYSLKTRKTSPYTIAKVSRRANSSLRYMYFISGESMQPHCCYKSNQNSGVVMDKDILKQGLKFCFENNIAPIFLGLTDHGLNHEDYLYYELIDYSKVTKEEAMPIYHGKLESYVSTINNSVAAILLINKENLKDIAGWVSQLLADYYRINLFIQDSDEEWEATEYECYNLQLTEVSNLLYRQYKAGNHKQINVLTDLIYAQEACDCGAGVTSIALAPDGNLYVCPGFYFDEKGKKAIVGNIESKEICLDKYIYKRSASETCIECPIKNCNRCRYSNFVNTNEMHIPTETLCSVNYINGKASNALQRRLENADLLKNVEYINDRKVNQYQKILERTK